MPPTGRSSILPPTPPKETNEEVVKYVRPEVCIACRGKGRASNNSECVPCEGEGVKGGKRRVVQPSRHKPIVKPVQVKSNLFD